MHNLTDRILIGLGSPASAVESGRAEKLQGPDVDTKFKVFEDWWAGLSLQSSCYAQVGQFAQDTG